jgi:hypothetical protein
VAILREMLYKEYITKIMNQGTGVRYSAFDMYVHLSVLLPYLI